MKTSRILSFLAAAVTAVGCAGEVVVQPPGCSGASCACSSSVVARLTESSLDKIDLVLAVDNSRSMADKQAVLAMAVPDLLRGLVNPSCVDPASGAPSASQPSGPLDPCPDPATKRAFAPILDIHVGVVTSSLGGHGSDACPDSETFSCPAGATNTSNNDRGHLVSRLDPCAAGSVPTYQGQGFLAWDPAGHDNPPGETSLGSVNVDVATGTVTTGTPGLAPNLKDMVIGAGQIGCGYESQMEGWYRFLVDPDPPQSLMIDAQGRVQRVGLDDVLLQQRKDFLRATSLLTILAITDENDASVKEEGQFYLVYQQRDPSNATKNFHLPKARAECATNPNDKCCRSCGQDQTGCPTDPTCGTLDEKTDDVNLREWHQKQRFGIDFLYPVDRYVAGLTQPVVPDRTGNMAPNAIFTNLSPANGDTAVRDASLVFLGVVVGVPWQDIAVDPTDLTKGFKTAEQLSSADAMGHTTWDTIIGDPASYVPPLDAHMIEDDKPRPTLVPPQMVEGGPDPISGHEYTPGTVMGFQDHPDDIEYACIFRLPAPRDCSDPTQISCDCSDPKNDNPLCADNGASGRTLQTHAKAYPGIRELAIAKALGPQGIVGSICAAQVTDPSAADFGYRPAINAVVGALTRRLTVEVAGQCFPKPLTPIADGQVACTVVEARNTNGAPCTCDGPARSQVPAGCQGLEETVKADPAGAAAGWNCFCQVDQTAGADLTACQNDPVATPVNAQGQIVNGWCYVDPAASAGSPAVVKECPQDEQRQVRFVGGGAPASGATIFLSCGAQ